MGSQLEGKTCVVTGAGAGIGAAVARAFSAEGARVVVNDVDRGRADEVSVGIREAGGQAVANYAAIGSVSSAEALLETALDSFGSVEVLVNNAGVLRDRMLHTMSEDDWDQVIAVHLKGTWACSREVVRHWRPLAKEEARSGSRTTRPPKWESSVLRRRGPRSSVPWRSMSTQYRRLPSLR